MVIPPLRPTKPPPPVPPARIPGIRREKLKKELEELRVERLRLLYERSEAKGREVRQIEQKLENNMTKIEQRLSERADLDLMDAIQQLPTSTEFATTGQDERYRKLIEEASERRSQKIATENREHRARTRIEVINVVFTGIMAFTLLTDVAALIVAIVDSLKSKNAINNLPPEIQQTLKEKIKQWKAVEEEHIWTLMAGYSNKYNPSLYGQVLMMDTIKRISPPPEPPWKWKNEHDQMTAIDVIVKAFNDCNPKEGETKSGAIYNTIKEYRYDGRGRGPEIPPRGEAAHLAELAVHQILKQVEEKEEE